MQQNHLDSLDKEEMKDCLEELSIVFVQAPTETAIKKAPTIALMLSLNLRVTIV